MAGLYGEPSMLVNGKRVAGQTPGLYGEPSRIVDGERVPGLEPGLYGEPTTLAEGEEDPRAGRVVARVMPTPSMARARAYLRSLGVDQLRALTGRR